MRFARIEDCEICNGPGVGVSLYTQGCKKRCKGCFNPETWDLNGGELFEEYHRSLIYKAMRRPEITRFSLLGGEPLLKENLFELNSVLCTIKSNWPDKQI